MSLLPQGELHHLVSVYGYWMVAGLVGLEGMGIPVPGEATLLLGALLAASGHDLAIAGVILAAIGGAILGDNIGFWLGRAVGSRLLLRYGAYVGLGESRIKLGRYLFLRHGPKVVFFGRCVALLRTLAPFLAGANEMDWRRFFLANAAGAAIWASLVGFGAYYFGEELRHHAGPVKAAILVIAVGAIILAWLMLRRHWVRLEAEAERAFPGPLKRRRRKTV